MQKREKQKRERLIVAAVVGIFLLTGCSAPNHLYPGDVEEGDVEEGDVEEGRIERWGCGDLLNGCGFGGCPVELTADFDYGSGTVEFAGTESHTRFEVKGLERRWDWCLQDDGLFGCAFTIDTQGDGAYFNFADAMPDDDGARRTKPSELFKCTRRRVGNR
ncbi:MAG: hypothetical protein OXU77_10705 [Gammaproteobacteria bacterium]|nr:hypothetical protein [Gammaproteobacteria bacterium]